MTSKEHPTATITTPNSTPGQSGRFGSERVAAFRRNQWPLSSECADWARRIKKRTSHKKACVALARKLATILHRMLITGEPFRWSAKQVATTA